VTPRGIEGFASSCCCRWTLGNHKQRKSRAGGGPFRAFRLCSFSCACACANLFVDILASGPWTASAPHLRWAFCAACRIRIMCTVALRTMHGPNTKTSTPKLCFRHSAFRIRLLLQTCKPNCTNQRICSLSFGFEEFVKRIWEINTTVK
jgi:hypothetical protein